jgi:LPPG:FO 2-phospho-L-lactate transferase
VTLLPVTDQEVETHVVVDDAGATLHFQEWWTRHRASIPARSFVQQGVEDAVMAPGIAAAIADADLIMVAPSNPVVSIGTVLGIPGVRDALAAAPAPIVGVSPIINGSVVRGMADACLQAIGVATSADAVARHYGARSSGGLLDAWLVDESDAAVADQLSDVGIRTTVVPLWMSDPATSLQLAADTVAAGLAAR